MACDLCKDEYLFEKRRIVPNTLVASVVQNRAWNGVFPVVSDVALASKRSFLKGQIFSVTFMGIQHRLLLS